MNAEELKHLVQILNPRMEPGKLSLITRYGCQKVESCLPEHIRAVQATGVPVVWVCDPCHGNTEMTEGGLKTRHFEKILKEVLLTFDIHKQEGSHLGGVHLELTGDGKTTNAFFCFFWGFLLVTMGVVIL
jgi:3-deoxy-7-phosphoheptulonate synthase